MPDIKYSRELLQDFDKLIKNLGNFVKFYYDYLQYAEPILKKCRPDIYKGRFSQIVDHYLEFHKKYF